MLNHVDFGINVTTVNNPAGCRPGTTFIPIPNDPTDRTLPHVIEALGGREAVGAMPVLELAKTGSTGYIDNVRASDMAAPIMRGIDQHGRPFFSVKLVFDDGEQVETLFRRYTTGSTWTSGGASAICAGALSPEDLTILRRLLQGETVRLRYDDQVSVRLAR